MKFDLKKLIETQNSLILPFIVLLLLIISPHRFCGFVGPVICEKVMCALVYRTEYSHAPHNDVSVNDGPHIRRSHKITIL